MGFFRVLDEGQEIPDLTTNLDAAIRDPKENMLGKVCCLNMFSKIYSSALDLLFSMEVNAKFFLIDV